MRSAKIERKTKETDIVLELTLDGTGKSEIFTGIGFFDHMLTSFARHGFFDMKLMVKGDLEVDCHHTIEDVGIVLGQAVAEALDGLPAHKMHCSVLAEEAIKSALKDYYDKNGIAYDKKLFPDCENCGHCHE